MDNSLLLINCDKIEELVLLDEACGSPVDMDWDSTVSEGEIPAVLPCHIERMGGVCKEQSYTKRPRLPVMETGGAAVLWETPQALQSLSAAES